MPLKTFWMLHKNIDRISAERDLRQVSIIAKTQSGEGVRELLKDLNEQYGKPYHFEISTPTEARIERTSRADLKRISAIGDLSVHVYPH